MHGFLEREEITENGRLKKHMSLTLQSHHGWPMEQASSLQGVISGVRPNSIFSTFVVCSLLSCIFSCLWSSLSVSSGQSSSCSLGKSSCLLSKRCSHTEDIRFALLCSHLVLTVYFFWSAPLPCLETHCQHCLCASAPTASLSQQPASSHSPCGIQMPKADPFLWWISYSQSEMKPLRKKKSVLE